MNKSVSIAALLVAVATITLSVNAAAAPKAPSAASAASAAHVHRDADATKAHLKAAKDRGTLMSGCQKKAAEANLHDVERKNFLTACMAGK